MIDLTQIPMEDLALELTRRGFDVRLSAAPKSNIVGKLETTPSQIGHVSENRQIVTQKEWKTLGGKAKSFTWTFKEGILTINRPEAKMTDRISLEQLYKVLERLNNEFNKEGKPVPLANDVSKLHSKEESDGFGKFMYEETESLTTAQAASQLASLLKELGVFIWNGKKRKMMFTMTRLPPIEELADLLQRHSS